MTMAQPMNRPDAPENRAARPRLGPRPLPLHLGLAALAWQSSKAALPLLRNGSLPWTADLAPAADALRKDLAGSASEAFEGAVAREVERRTLAFITGLQAYRAHPYRRDLDDPPTVWQEGTTRLIDYLPGGNSSRGTAKGAAALAPVLVVPSLINRAYILDLNARTSLLRWLAGRGFRPFLVDWDRPGAEERGFTLSDYVAGRLDRALDHVLALTGRKPHLLGYCMGGLLALALAVRRGQDLRALALLATPWDFHAEQPAQARLVADSLTALEPLLALQGELPVDVIQGLFASLDPLQVVRKFVALSSLAPDEPAALRFVAVEDWLNDGVPLAAPVARECLGGWYGGNLTAEGAWQIDGEAVVPQRVSLPSLCILPDQDRIVPPASAAALAKNLPGAKIRQPAVGHVGMIVSTVARRRVWRPLAAWLAET